MASAPPCCRQPGRNNDVNDINDISDSTTRCTTVDSNTTAEQSRLTLMAFCSL
jgi:hypothetical protein